MDAKPALEVCATPLTFTRIVLRLISFLIDYYSLKRFVFYCGPLKTPALPLIVCRMPKEVLQKNPKPNPQNNSIL